MKLKFNLLLCLVFPVLAMARPGDISYKKTVTKEFNVSDGAVLGISNKYGKIVFHSWDKNVIKATVLITGFGKNEDDAQKIADMVDINAEGGSSSVQLRTVYTPGKGGSWFSWGSKIDSKDFVNIDYDVYIPRSLRKMMIENNFGDVIADKFNFPVTLSMNYCTYDIREAADVTLRINYCDKGKIGKAGNVNVNGNYSSLRSEQLDGLTTHSNYSSYVVTYVNDLKVHGTYDDYKMERVGTIDAHTTYTDLRLGELSTEASVRMTYGDFSAKRMGSAFKGGEFNLTFADLKLNFPRKLSLQLDINLVFGDLKTGGLELKNVTSNKKASSLAYTAQTAAGSEQSPTLKIKGTNADIHLDAM
ncbi:DUF4097 family beta strand repeat-containing protein [Chitinophaga vietnamensis]|uniref:hypothetical protein n=1 Tax=Chitinophaga vietnamensis TaxID=2593957 RepID=UPI00117897F7|nr:hypothetical protein [Chitinophaga vietnamensis]